ncbi:MAG: tRNA pseudouridine(38-40) synthase TruA, partial [Deltaproteobacteria bacterium]|nr:tRNA pseudouridine(38-40) synthase TruA [Deltaproteobacteria bacterium]
QPQHLTIQQVLQETIAKIVNQPITLHGSGRTDAGVHALGQVAHFRANTRLERVQLLNGLNSLLPQDIRVVAVDLEKSDFHARYDATCRTYWYWFWNTVQASPFYGRYSWHIKRPLDLQAMNRAAQQLTGIHDFKSFQGADRQDVCSTREVTRAGIKRVNRNMLLFEIRANAFLKHMVRNIVGTLVDVGIEKIEPHALADILAGKDRTCAGLTAPPQGLFLKMVSY